MSRLIHPKQIQNYPHVYHIERKQELFHATRIMPVTLQFLTPYYKTIVKAITKNEFESDQPVRFKNIGQYCAILRMMKPP